MCGRPVTVCDLPEVDFKTFGYAQAPPITRGVAPNKKGSQRRSKTFRTSDGAAVITIVALISDHSSHYSLLLSFGWRAEIAVRDKS